MTQPNPTDVFSVEHYVGRFSGSGENRGLLFARALGAIEGTLDDPRIGDAERCRQIRNIITATNTVRDASDAAAEALTYSRQDDDPQVVRPHSPRVPLHTGAVVDGGALVPFGCDGDPCTLLHHHPEVVNGGALVDETPAADLVHLLEPGSHGEDDDRVACGLLVRDLGEFTTYPARADCLRCLEAVNGMPIYCRECGHQMGRHHDLVGCAVDGCECVESKATLLSEAR